ncbi:MAG: leucine-rich repeat protein [Clostridia bacterium]|nr:leucine-rich repeat protein [Clostridia bacterium]
MKKKILITLLVVAMACLFALTVSAANEVTLTDGTTVDFGTVFIVKNNQVTGFQDGYTKDSATDIIFPDEIEGIECNVMFNAATSLKTLTFLATDTFFISGDGIFTGCSVEKITFNPNCVAEIRKGNFSDCTSLTQITFPKFKVLTGSAFKGCSNMVATNELILVEGMTEIGGHAFNGCTSLTGTVSFPASLVKIQEYSFQNTGFEHFDLSKCANLTLVGGGYGGPFTDNDSITSLDLSGCTSLTDLKGNFAANCDNLVEVILPPNLENIPSKAFAHCYKMKSIVLPATLKTIADEAFHSARAGQDVKTFTVYIQSNVQFGVSYPFRDSSAKIEYVLIGDGITAQTLINANTFSGVTGATVVDYLDEASPWTYEPGKTITAHTIVENYCKPLAISGSHGFISNPCVSICSDCRITVAQENPQHVLVTSIAYASGYTSVGTKIEDCSNEGCQHKTEVETKALFINQGYSEQQYANGGIQISFVVNHDAIAEYNTANKTNITYGIFAVAQGNAQDEEGNDKAIINADGTAIAGVASVDFSKYTYDIFAIRVIGFETDVHKEAQLALGAYVIDGGKVTYLQEGTPAENQIYCYTSYNAQANA